jgi:hypothetical protein
MSVLNYIEAPSHDMPERGRISVFLAGGITDCPDWQAEAREWFTHSAVAGSVTLFNPRRAAYAHTSMAAAQQIRWEYDRLRQAQVLLFWFPKETLCPITLYELGAWSMTGKPMVIGAHDDYARRVDIVLQTGFVRPEVCIYPSILSAVDRACKIISRLSAYPALANP